MEERELRSVKDGGIPLLIFWLTWGRDQKAKLLIEFMEETTSRETVDGPLKRSRLGIPPRLIISNFGVRGLPSATGLKDLDLADKLFGGGFAKDGHWKEFLPNPNREKVNHDDPPIHPPCRTQERATWR
jgi:hypothetical protein